MADSGKNLTASWPKGIGLNGIFQKPKKQELNIEIMLVMCIFKVLIMIKSILPILNLY